MSLLFQQQAQDPETVDQINNVGAHRQWCSRRLRRLLIGDQVDERDGGHDPGWPVERVQRIDVV